MSHPNQPDETWHPISGDNVKLVVVPDPPPPGEGYSDQEIDDVLNKPVRRPKEETSA